jgi:uncharacterized membrane protein
MTPTFLLLVVLSACLHALWNCYSKASRSPQIFFFWVGAFTAAIAIIIFAIRLPIIHPTVWIYVVASGLVHSAYWFSLSQAYSSGDISYVYPIARSAPGFIPLFAFLFLQEAISVQGLIGILCIVFSIYLLQQQGDGLRFKELIRRTKQQDATWAFSTLCTVIIYSLIDKKGMSEFHAPSTQLAAWQAVSYYLTQGAISIVLYGISTLLRFPKREITDVARREWKRIIVAGWLILISYTLILFAFITQKVSYVVAIRQCSVIFAVLLGTYVLKESHAKLRFAAAGVMVVGVFLISTA